MTGDEEGDDSTYDQPRVPAALRDRINELFLEYRGYEPATFQESLSLVTDLAAARVEAELEGAADSGPEELDTTSEADDQFTSPGLDDADAAAGSEEAVEQITADVIDDASSQEFAELDAAASGGPTGDGGDATGGDGGATAAASDADDPVSGTIPESLRADPESNCALCGDLHPVSVLETTILDGAGSVALVCPSCAE